jgi:heme-degrading monooxygenase HmoA
MKPKANEHYSFGAWTIKPGREDEFKTAWNDFAQWTAEARAGAAEGVLVQDIDDPRLFYCFWPFDSQEAIDRWRSDLMFRQHMMRMKAYCENCRPSVTKMVGKV